MTKALPTLLLLCCSNIFMTAAWYGQLRFPQAKLWVAILVSWAIALFEYCLAVPANRIGYANGLSTAQLKIMQECVTLAVFAIFAAILFKEPITWRYLGAGACIAGAAAFIFVGR
ncbi:MAG: DMT family protein [Sphingomonadaceae bacterium]|nr:DMT family protein [Sphingomonadaceae bacterium]